MWSREFNTLSTTFYVAIRSTHEHDAMPQADLALDILADMVKENDDMLARLFSGTSIESLERIELGKVNIFMV